MVIFITLLVYGAKIPVFIEYIALQIQNLYFLSLRHPVRYPCATHFGKLSKFAKVFLPANSKFKIHNYSRAKDERRISELIVQLRHTSFFEEIAPHTLANFQSLPKFFYPPIQNSKFKIIPQRTLSEGLAKV